ncbi:MAG: hypothetical protein FJ298_05035 [Planctomycetes bacterium]|nr:hypothetical protein [Planctomycetota bacterium]
MQRQFAALVLALAAAAAPAAVAAAAAVQGAQSAPTVVGFREIDSNEPAMAGLLDTADRFGRDFNPLGDLDLDGVTDLVVGARSDDDGGIDAGAVYILFLQPNGAVRSVAKISATSGGLAAAGITLGAGQFFGYSVSPLGDLDGDGVEDIAVGARRSGAQLDGGGIFVLFLRRDGSVRAAQRIDRNVGNLGYALANTDFFGEASSFLGVLGGVPTLAVSDANNDDGGVDRGAIYLLRLASNGMCLAGQNVKISSTSGGFGAGLVDNDQFGGRDIVPLGDLDGDGMLDLAVGAFQSDGERGAVWILRMNPNLTVKAKQKIGHGIGGLQLQLATVDHFGHAVAAPGDLDGDGVPDLITSANQRDEGGLNVGELYFLLLNSDGTVRSEARLGATTGGLPFSSLPISGRFGRTLAVVGDLANDGTLCLASGGGAGETGTVYLLFFARTSEAVLTDPRRITGNVLWLDGNDVDGDLVAGGNWMGGQTWVDKSSAGLGDASQASAAARPALAAVGASALTLVHFDGDDFLDLAAPSFDMLRNSPGASVFAVARPTQPSAQQAFRVFMASTGTNSAATRVGFNFFDGFGTGLGGTGDAGLAGRRLDTDAYQRINGGGASLGALAQWTGEFDFFHARLGLRCDGQPVTAVTGFQTPGQTSDSASLNIRIGADASLNDLRGFFSGDLAELIVYDRLLLPSERTLVERYLARKWSVITPQQFCLPTRATSQGCVPRISLASSPSVGHATQSLLAVAGVDALRSGLLFYGVSGPAQQSLCGGAANFLCVAGPRQRMTTVNTGGTAGTCEGSIVSDWSAYQLAHPAALGNPWLAGETVDVQGWFRDPAACGGASLTEALRFVYR